MNLFKKKQIKEEEQEETPVQNIEVTPPETQREIVKTDNEQIEIKIETPEAQLLFLILQRLDALVEQTKQQ